MLYTTFSTIIPTRMSKAFTILSFILLNCLPQHSNAQTTALPRALTKSDYAKAESRLSYATAPFVDRATVQAKWLSDGKFWYSVLISNGIEYVLINPVDGSRKSAKDLKTLGVTPEVQMKATSPRPKKAVSPDGHKTAFIREWNLWVRDSITKKETQLTTDGIKDFGYATDNAGWTHSDRPILLWSPDSKKIATFQQDQRHVNDMYLVTTNVGQPKLEAWKYPLPDDEEIIKISRVIIDIEKVTVVRLNIPADPRRGTLCDDISCSGSFDDNEWNPGGTRLAFVSSSRDHKTARLRIADAVTGEVTEVMDETVPTQYESGQGAVNWRFLPKSKEFIWYSERDDWGHLYLYDQAGKLKNQITKGSFVITRMLRVDEQSRTIYFEAQGKEAGRDPYFSHFYSIDFKGKNLKLLTPDDGHHQIQLSADGKYFIDSWSKPNLAPTVSLRDMKGKSISILEKCDISRLEQTGWRPPTPVTVKSRDNRWDLYGLIFTPPNTSASAKYPVILYIYPGPQGGSVGSRSFNPSRADCQALTELGFVVVQIDGTCNPGRSKSFHDLCYGNMGDNTLEDQISGLKQLTEKYPYMDLDRVGIWGHSGGGFATAAAMFRYPEFFKVGISESGNHDNRNYEDDWGERYIGLQKKDDDGNSNYQAQANQYLAKNLKGKLMLAHGGMDDNVPPYNTYLVVEALERANKDFDLVLIPNARHGYGRDTYYMMRRRWDYFVKYLLGAEPPKEYELKPQTDSRR
ncbi:MAG: DPP IV N-terminal domain-containing protein [Chryseolinea sp.]